MDPDTILIVRRNRLGDFLLSIPLAKLCKERWPGVKISYLVEKEVECLAKKFPEIDEVFAIASSPNKYWGVAKTIWQMRCHTFDLILSAKPTPMKLVNLLVGGLRGRKKRGYVEGNWHGRLLNDGLLFKGADHRHQALQILHLMDPGILKVQEHLYPVLQVEPKKRTLSGPILLLSVSNHRDGSRFEIDRYARIASKWRGSILITGVEKDLERGKALERLLLQPKALVFSDSLPLFLSTLASVDACFIGDGGISHMAAALGVAQLVAFGGTNVWEWAPLSSKAVVVSHRQNVNEISEEVLAEALEKLCHSIQT